MDTDTLTIKTEELRVDTHEIDMILLERQIQENNLRTKNKFIIFLKKLFKKGNL